MLAWIHRKQLKRAAWLSLTLCLGACASVLGIEERQEDSAANYPATGYEGCRPGVSCAGCLAVHERECELRGACSAAVSSDDCTGCVCESCADSVVDCQRDAGCAAIWQCLKQSRCDLSERSASSCLTACGSVIEARGGVAGQAFRAAADVRTCAITSSCLSCLAPEPEPVAGCDKANGCQACPDCFRQCICTGEKFGACKQLCGTEAPPDACTQANSCVGCDTCFDLCTCGGGSYDHCTSACQVETTPPAVMTCRPETSCSDCADCSSLCACHGGDQAECQSQCASASPDDVCVQSALGSGTETCGGCSGCVAHCSCSGTPLEQCMDDCGMLSCCGNCSSPMTECSCTPGSSADSCGAANYSCDAADSCSACACRSCPGTYALCEETQDCPAVFACMAATQCTGSKCRERCGAVASEGADGAAFDVAEALWACDQANSCTCESPPDPTTLCPGPDGDIECADYRRGTARFGACCPDSRGTGSSPSVCGLDLGRDFHALACEPFEQGNKPRPLESCPKRTIFEPPYNGVTLAGCCNAAENKCGVFDDVTGLGCLRSSVFGMQAGACGLL
ncbi:MAG: hypothetical protein ABI895_09165 [Deltaproteobacteria bacterium]